MAKYFMLGKYSTEAAKGITADRTKKVVSTIEKSGGKVINMYALLGSYDLAFIVDYSGIQDALKASVALTKATDIGFTTFPALTVEEFDKVIG